MNIKLVNALESARFEIETKGLYKGQLEGPKGAKGPCCMMGALNRTIYNKSTLSENTRWNTAYDLLDTVVPDNNIPRFNDLKSTKKKDALKIFDAAISLALSNKV